MWPLAVCLIDTKTPLSQYWRLAQSYFEVSELQPSCCTISACSKQLLWHQESHLRYMSQVIHNLKQTTCPPLDFLHASHSLYYLIPTLLVWEVKKQNIQHCQLARELSPQSESCSLRTSPHDLFHNSTVSHWPSVRGPRLLLTWDREGPAAQLP